VEQDAFVRLHARDGEEGAVEEALREVARPSREEAGCLSFQVFRSVRDRRLFYIHSRWVDEGAFRTHAELAHTVRFLERVDALVDQPREVGRMEKID
jgi:quinol monooxygenase YgiN